MKTLALRHARGFTLIELMMALAVLGILVASAAPAFGKLIQSTQAQTARAALTTALDTARIFAITKHQKVAVCPSADQQYCGDNTEWQHGWLVFIDTDEDGERDDSEKLLSVAQAQPEGVAILSTAGRKHVNYRPDGSAIGSNVTLTVCDRRGAADASSLVINNGGRIRSGKPSPAAASACENAIGA